MGTTAPRPALSHPGRHRDTPIRWAPASIPFPSAVAIGENGKICLSLLLVYRTAFRPCSLVHCALIPAEHSGGVHTGGPGGVILVDAVQSEQLVTTRTLRRRVFALAGQLTRSPRRLTLHPPPPWPWETQCNRPPTPRPDPPVCVSCCVRSCGERLDTTTADRPLTPTVQNLPGQSFLHIPCSATATTPFGGSGLRWPSPRDGWRWRPCRLCVPGIGLHRALPCIWESLYWAFSSCPRPSRSSPTASGRRSWKRGWRRPR